MMLMVEIIACVIYVSRQSKLVTFHFGSVTERGGPFIIIYGNQLSL